MGIMKNTHCKDCNSRTKLLLKKGKQYKVWCAIGKTCPCSIPYENKSEVSNG